MSLDVMHLKKNETDTNYGFVHLSHESVSNVSMKEKSRHTEPWYSNQVI